MTEKNQAVTVPSFSVDHRTLKAGLYLREDRTDLPIRVWDLRFKAPADKKYLTIKVLHSIEHLFALKLREVFGSDYVAVMVYGCRTGFGLITKNNVELATLRQALIDVIERTVPITCKSDIPCLTELECGNPYSYSINGTNAALREYCEVLKNI